MDSGGLLRSGIIPSAPIFSLTSRRGLCEGCQRSPVGQVHDHTADAVNGGKGDPATPLNAPVRAGKWLTGAFYGSRPVVIYPPPLMPETSSEMSEFQDARTVLATLLVLSRVRRAALSRTYLTNSSGFTRAKVPSSCLCDVAEGCLVLFFIVPGSPFFIGDASKSFFVP